MKKNPFAEGKLRSVCVDTGLATASTTLHSAEMRQ